MIWGIAGAVAAVIASMIYWRIRKRRQPRLISLVALLREPMKFDPAVLAQVAGKAWNADLGDGSSEGPDGFVVGMDVMTTIMHEGRMFMLNSFPRPYVDDVESVAESIVDLRLRELFREHQAWFSCDAMGIDGRTSAAEVRDWYQRLGRLFAELLDDNCLMIFLPDSGAGFAINEETEEALQADDPVQALQDTLTAPVVEIADDDPLMVQAVTEAKQEWAKFVTAYEAQAGENFTIKAPVTRDDHTEFIWIEVTCLEGERIYGTLGNEPANLPGLRLGSKVSVLLDDLNDWCYIDPEGQMQGGFTIAALQKAARRKRKR